MLLCNNGLLMVCQVLLLRASHNQKSLTTHQLLKIYEGSCENQGAVTTLAKRDNRKKEKNRKQSG